jgi:hypothetical protein
MTAQHKGVARVGMGLGSTCVCRVISFLPVTRGVGGTRLRREHEYTRTFPYLPPALNHFWAPLVLISALDRQGGKV